MSVLGLCRCCRLHNRSGHRDDRVADTDRLQARRRAECMPRCLQWRCRGLQWQQLSHDGIHGHIDDTLTTDDDAVDELIRGSQKTMLHKQRLLVPVDDLGRLIWRQIRLGLDPSIPTYPRDNLEAMEGSDEATIAYGSCTLKHRSAQSGNGAIQLSSLVEVDAGKVQFPKIAGIIHVIEQGVHIGAQADACRGRGSGRTIKVYL